MSVFSSASRPPWRSGIIATIVVALLPALAAGAKAVALTPLYNFSGSLTGKNPSNTLVQGGDGNFYGTTQRGGTGSFGTVFAITPAGVSRTLYNFDGLAQGGSPAAALIQGTDGNFYGTTQQGGTGGFGTVFAITPAGALTTLHSFNGNDGFLPNALVQGTDGNFYGTTQQGGAGGYGTVFAITPAGALTTLYSFSGGSTDGSLPAAALIQGTDGNFYGTTQQGGTSGVGTVFEISPVGSSASLYRIRYDFGGVTDGSMPAAALVLGTDGNFYGTTRQGSAGQSGTVFQLTPTGTLTTLYTFGGGSNGFLPDALLLGTDGNFYGTTQQGGASGVGTMFQITPAGVLTTLYSFSGGSDGLLPNSLISGIDGNFYGTTQQGGASGVGTMFQITPAGTLTTLYGFGGNPDGSIPSAALVRGTNGNFYGTTQRGGAGQAGTVYQVTPAGELTTLYSFGGGSDGAGPAASLALGTDSNFYGTTQRGGAVQAGTVFQVTPAGVLTTLYSFGGGTDGSSPAAVLAMGTDGNFYGTTQQGGAGGFGTVFRITPAGGLTTLHSFSGGTDGFLPNALALGTDGNFYGTTQHSNGINGFGTVFQVTPAGALTTIYTFSGGTDGSIPAATLVQAGNGNFYGTTLRNGTNGLGTAFQVTPAGALTTFYSFGGGTDGSSPAAALVEGDQDYLYGTATAGGVSDLGSIFRLGPIPLPAPVVMGASVANAVVGDSFTYQIAATNAPASFNATGLPAGLGINTATGLISGTPTVAGSFAVTLSATNNQGTGTGTLTLTVVSLAPVITSGNMVGGTTGNPLNYQITATNAPTSFGATGLPAGLGFNTATGLISGTPTVAGSYAVMLSATNGRGMATSALTLTVVMSAPMVTLTAAVPKVVIGSGQVGEFALSLPFPLTNDLHVNYTISGTGTNGTDYVYLKGQAKIKAGKMTKIIKVTPLGDLGGVTKKTVKLTLANGTGYAINSGSSAKVKLFAAP